jgi:hypothetical protein
MTSRKIGGNKFPQRNPHFSAKQCQQNVNIPRKSLTFWRDERQPLKAYKRSKEKNLLYLWKKKDKGFVSM